MVSKEALGAEHDTQEFVSKEPVVSEQRAAGRQKLGYFSLLKYLGFIDVNRTVRLYSDF